MENMTMRDSLVFYKSRAREAADFMLSTIEERASALTDTDIPSRQASLTVGPGGMLRSQGSSPRTPDLSPGYRDTCGGGTTPADRLHKA